VSLSFARLSRGERTAPASDALAAGILLAWMMMFARVVLTVTIVNAALVGRLLVPFAILAAVSAALAGWFYWRSQDGRRPAKAETEVPVKNPFSLTAATRFGLLFAAMLVVVKFTGQYLSTEGLYVVAAIAGFTDVDAITLSMTEYARSARDFQTAAGAIAVAALTNTLAKCGFVLALGSPLLRRRLLAATLVLLAAGLGALWLT
jgi:uncharacterized membrane protein (DUF4010 family)